METADVPGDGKVGCKGNNGIEAKEKSRHKFASKFGFVAWFQAEFKAGTVIKFTAEVKAEKKVKLERKQSWEESKSPGRKEGKAEWPHFRKFMSSSDGLFTDFCFP